MSEHWEISDAQAQKMAKVLGRWLEEFERSGERRAQAFGITEVLLMYVLARLERISDQVEGIGVLLGSWRDGGSDVGLTPEVMGMVGTGGSGDGSVGSDDEEDMG